MAKTAYINARVEPKLKHGAEKILKEVGVNMTDFVEMSLRQVVLRGGVPFPVRRLNKETLKAIRDLRAGKGARYTGATEEIFDAILKER